MAGDWRLRQWAVLLVLVLVAGGTVHFAVAEAEELSYGDRLGSAKDSVVETVKNVLPGETVEAKQDAGSNSWADWAVDRINLLADGTKKKIIESYEADTSSKKYAKVMDAAAAAKESTQETLQSHFSEAGAKLVDANAAAVDTTLRTYETVKDSSINVLEKVGLKEKPKPEKTYPELVADALSSAKESVTTTASGGTDYVKRKSGEAAESAKQTYDGASGGLKSYASTAAEHASVASDAAKEYSAAATDSVTQTSRDAYLSAKENTVGLSEEEKPDEGVLSTLPGKAKEYATLAGEQASAFKDSATETSRDAYLSAKEKTVGLSDEEKPDEGVLSSVQGKTKGYATLAGEQATALKDSASETSRDAYLSAKEKTVGLSDEEKPDKGVVDSIQGKAKEYAAIAGEQATAIKDSATETSGSIQGKASEYAALAGEHATAFKDSATGTASDAYLSAKEKTVGLSEEEKPDEGVVGSIQGKAKEYAAFAGEQASALKDSATETSGSIQGKAKEYAAFAGEQATAIKDSAAETSESIQGKANEYAAFAGEHATAFKDSATETSRDGYLSAKEKSVGLSDEEKPDEGLVGSIKGKASEYAALAGEQATAIKDSAAETSGSIQGKVSEYGALAGEQASAFKDSASETSRDAYLSAKEKTVGLSEEEKPDEGLVGSIQGKANEYAALTGEQATAVKDSATGLSTSTKEYANSTKEMLGETYESNKEHVLNSAAGATETSKDYARAAGEKLGIIEKPEPSTTVTDSAVASKEKVGEMYDSSKQAVVDSATAANQKTKEAVDSAKAYISGKDEL